MIAVFCYHVWQLWPLAWYNLKTDWIIFHPEPVIASSVDHSKRPSPKSVIMFQRKSLKGLRVCFQAHYKQGTNSYQLVWCFWWYWMLSLSPHHTQVDPSDTPKQTPCWPISVHLKEAFKKEIDKMLQVGISKPVNQATPWIHSIVLVEGRDKQGNLTFRICLDTTTLNKAINLPKLPMHQITSHFMQEVIVYKI